VADAFAFAGSKIESKPGQANDLPVAAMADATKKTMRSAG